METKTTPLYDSTHEDIKNAQSILNDRYSINMAIKDIIKCVMPGPEEIVEKVFEKITDKLTSLEALRVTSKRVIKENIIA